MSWYQIESECGKLKKWEDLPPYMKNEKVKWYYDRLSKHKTELKLKRAMDIVLSAMLIIILMPVLLVVSILIKADSSGPVFFKQVRVTTNGEKFKIFKFRTMVNDAEKKGSQVTVSGDSRVTKVGRKLRKYRIDEIPQLFNVIKGEMSFVGTRPEVEKYVAAYTDEMKATLLLPAGITSVASIKFKDEEKLLQDQENVDEVYISKVLPQKMKYNLKAIERFSLWGELKTMIDTVLEVVK